MTGNSLFIDGPPPPSTGAIRTAAKLELLAELEAERGRWRRLTPADLERIGGGLSLALVAGAQGSELEVHVSDDGTRWARLRPVQPPRPRRLRSWWRRHGQAVLLLTAFVVYVAIGVLFALGCAPPRPAAVPCPPSVCTIVRTTEVGAG